MQDKDAMIVQAGREETFSRVYAYPAGPLTFFCFYYALIDHRRVAETLFQVLCFHHFNQAEKCCSFYRVFKMDQFCIGPLIQAICERFSIFLFIDLQRPGGLLPPQDHFIELHLSHTSPYPLDGCREMREWLAGGESVEKFSRISVS